MSSYSHSILVFALLCLLFSMTPNPSNGEFSESILEVDSQNSGINFENDTAINEAMDALNKIQVSGDGGMMLYMTFPNIHHKECKGTTSSFEISRNELHDVLIEVMNKNNRSLSDRERSKLATTASLPRELYTIKACGVTNETLEINKSEVPGKKGTWIITEIFGVSDLLINW